MQTQTDLIESSLAILRRGQQPSGAFLASPSFPVYRYSWFRDGAFIAQALDLWGEHARARRFYHWGARVVLRYADVIHRALAGPAGLTPSTYLHTRYSADGTPADDDWPNFQLDGFGTFLWGMIEHSRLTETSPLPDEWRQAVDLAASYLAHLWRSPTYDCWEEHPDQVHTSTLCALYGGMSAVAGQLDHARCGDTAHQIRRFLLDHVTTGGHLPKFIGAQEVDGSLLWACLPFGLLAADDPVMERTVRKIDADLVGPYGGVHRYATDSYYGGGEWILLTALLGEYALARGDEAGAARLLRWIEQQASPAGELPEQVARDLNCPEMHQPWVDRWGPAACPLLWSHAAYLRLKHALHQG